MSLILPEANNRKRYPALIMMDGQYMVDMFDLNGNHIQRMVSPAHVRQAFTNEIVDSGWLDSSVQIIRWGMNRHGEIVVGYIPPKVHKLPFMGLEDATSSEITELSVPLPGLMFSGNGGTYAVWATRSESFDPYGKIYKAPLPNVETIGEICFGPHKPPRANGQTISKAWNIFISTPFNNHRVNEKSKSHPSDVRTVYKELAASGATQYPVDDLVPYADFEGLSIDNLFNGYFTDDVELMTFAV